MMLKQASVTELRKGTLTKAQGYLSICMRTYPRGLKKELSDEYRSDLAPAIELFRDFKDLQATVGHQKAFEECQYQSRFELSRRALMHLEELVKISRSQDVYLICQCEVGEFCHRELLLIIAEHKFGATIEPIQNAYPIYLERLQNSK
ncbi:MAG: DUF488 family protein, N3 subclade [Pseudobdellovibrionaceae bacterium]